MWLPDAKETNKEVIEIVSQMINNSKRILRFLKIKDSERRKLAEIQFNGLLLLTIYCCYVQNLWHLTNRMKERNDRGNNVKKI